jgi:hypothetical protein
MMETGGSDDTRGCDWLPISISFLALIVAVGLALLGIDLSPMASEYRVFVSPDGNFKIIVYCMPMWFSRMPGDAGGAPGYVRVVDRHGQALREKAVVVVQAIDQVDWGSDAVHIRLFVDWSMPP